MTGARERWRAGGLLLVAAATLGWGSRCDQRTDERIEMRVRADALERTLTNLRPTGPGQASGHYYGEREHELREIYGKPTPSGSFRRRFRSVIPADFGGSGALIRDVTSMGRVVTYRERLRGQESPQKLREALDEGVVQAHQLTDGWIRAELGERPATRVLETWLHDRVIPDLRVLAFYGWLAQSDRLGWAEHEQRVVQFLVERAYFRSEDTPRLRDPSDAWRIAWRHQLERGGVRLDAELEAALRFLDDDGGLDRSLSARMLRSQSFETWLESAKDRSDAKEFLPLSPDGVAAFLAGEQSEAAKRVDLALHTYTDQQFSSAQVLLGFAIAGEWLADMDSVEIFLELPEPPIESNGAWNPATRRVEWKRVAAPGPKSIDDSYRLSDFPFATWAEPATEFQTAHFGRVALRGKALRSYNVWYEELEPSDQTVWDAFVATLSPGAELVATLKQFRFPDEPSTPDENGRIPRTRAEDGVEPIVEALKTPQDASE